METVFLESIQKENTSLFTPMDCFPVNKVPNRTAFMKQSSVLKRFDVFFCDTPWERSGYNDE